MDVTNTMGAGDFARKHLESGGGSELPTKMVTVAADLHTDDGSSSITADMDTSHPRRPASEA